jgi:hypothetical protein
MRGSLDRPPRLPTTVACVLLVVVLVTAGCSTARPLGGAYPHRAMRGQTLEGIRADEARCDRRAGGESASYIACMLSAGYAVRVKIPWAAVAAPPEYLVQPPAASKTVAAKTLSDCIASAQASRLIDTFPACLRARGLISEWAGRP